MIVFFLLAHPVDNSLSKHRVRIKLFHYNFGSNFAKYWSIFKIFSFTSHAPYFKRVATLPSQKNSNNVKHM